MNLGAYKIPAGKSITIGTFDSVPEELAPYRYHDGIYYNYEAYAVYTSGNVYADNLALTTTLVPEDEATIRAFLQTASNNTWSETKNCAYFAMKLWNTVYGDTFSLTRNHYTQMSELKSKGWYVKSGISIPTAKLSEAYYQATSDKLVSITSK